MFEGDHLYLDFVGGDSLYGSLAWHGYQLFEDEDFADLCSKDNGRPGVPPDAAMMVAAVPEGK